MEQSRFILRSYHGDSDLWIEGVAGRTRETLDVAVSSERKTFPRLFWANYFCNVAKVPRMNPTKWLEGHGDGQINELAQIVARSRPSRAKNLNPNGFLIIFSSNSSLTFSFSWAPVHRPPQSGHVCDKNVVFLNSCLNTSFLSGITRTGTIR